MKTLAFFNQKGGVGKSTSVIQVSSFLARDNNKVLVVDGDPQANATGFFLYNTQPNGVLAEYIRNEKSLSDIITPALISKRDGAKPCEIGIDVIAISRTSFGDQISQELFQHIVEEVKDNYDYIVFDCPPALSDMSVAILAATEYVFVPLEADVNSASGASELLDTIEEIKASKLNPQIKIGGTFINKYNGNTNFAKYMYEQFKEQFGDMFIDQVIRSNVAVYESAFFSRPFAWFKKGINAARDYEALTEIIKERMI